MLIDLKKHSNLVYIVLYFSSVLCSLFFSCTFILQIATEHLFEHFEHKFRNKEGFKDVLRKIKDELMLMGFISVRKVQNCWFVDLLVC